MIPESVKARIEKEGESLTLIQDFNYPENNWSPFEAAQQEFKSGYISGATAEYERAQQAIEALKSCLSFIEELKEHGVTQCSGEIYATQALKNYNQ